MRSQSHLCVLRKLATATVIAVTVNALGAITSNADERAIRAAGREYVAAKQRGDLEALRKMWTPDGDYIDAAGQVFKAQDLMREQTATPPANSTTADLPTLDSSIRLISPEVAIEDGGSVVPDDGSTVGGRFTAVWVKRDGRWLLDSLRESITVSPPYNERLRPLQWLLGEWVGATDDAVVLVSAHWSDDGKYIVRDFLVRADGREDISATQRIGWDASDQTIRCWTFDSQGGHGEGVWRNDAQRWIVDSTETSADGRKSKTSAVYTPGEDGSFVSELKAQWSDPTTNAAPPSLPALLIQFRRALEDE
jgi:uncharacterized protein (TIGR02246 family)